VSKPRLLWVSDGVVHTGFARVAHSVLPHLMADFEVGMLAAHFNGDPHSYRYPIWPAFSPVEWFGFTRLPEVAKTFKPDVVLVLNDSYYVAKFAKLRTKLEAEWKLVGYMPMDGPNLHPEIADALSELDAAIFYTRFGLETALAAGFHGKASIIPHGIDLDLFRVVPRETARRITGISPDGFIVGNANRNQPRKRLDLTIAFFADWVDREKLPADVKLYLHCAAKDVHISDIAALAGYYGVRDRLILPDKALRWDKGVAEEHLSAVYSAMDVQISTSLGEGWGLTTMEGMACGVPQIVPEWSGLAEWARGAVEYVPCTEVEVFAGFENRIGGVPDREAFVGALSRLYQNAEQREDLSLAGLELVSRPEFEWANVARAFSGVLHTVLNGETKEAAVA
jgi:D-inositol-3-phosphate glycosyltransferase